MKGLRDHNAYADSAWPETIQSLKRAGFGRIYPAEKWPGSVDDGIVWLRSLKQIIINPACKRLAEEATLWRWKTDLQGNPLPKLADGNEHGWDAVRYAMGGYIKQRAAPPPASMRLIS
jgi:phage terminase large subunit